MLASDAVGLEVPVNLLFFGAAIVMLVLSLQHSSELGRLEERTRTLAEEIALLHLDLDVLAPRSRPVDTVGEGAAPASPGERLRDEPSTLTAAPGS